MATFDDLTDERFHIVKYLQFDEQIKLLLVCKDLYFYLKKHPCIWEKINIVTFLKMCDYELPTLHERLKNGDGEVKQKVFNYLLYILSKDCFSQLGDEEMEKRFSFGMNRINSSSVKSIEFPSYSLLFFEKLPEICPLLEEIELRFFPKNSIKFDVKEMCVIKKLNKLKKITFFPYEFSSAKDYGVSFSEEFLDLLEERQIDTNMKKCFSGRKEFHCYSTLIRCEQRGLPMCHTCWNLLDEEKKIGHKFSMIGYCDVCLSGCYCGSVVDDDFKSINDDPVPHCLNEECYKMACQSCLIRKKNISDPEDSKGKATCVKCCVREIME